MRVFSFCRGALLAFSLFVLVFAATQSQADDQIVEVVGIGECADCKEQNIQTNLAFTGLHVTIDCKDNEGYFDRWGVGELDNEGRFKVSIPQQILQKDGNSLKHECYAQLHSAASAPCPAHNGLEATKIVAKLDADGKHASFEPAQKLKFSTALCTSATLWPFHKYPPMPKFPPLPDIDFWKHHFGHHHFNFHKKPSPPVYKKPEPPVSAPKTPEPPITVPKNPAPPVPVPVKPEPPSKPKKSKPSAPKKPLPPSEPKKKKKKEGPKKQKSPVVKPPSVHPPVVKPPSVKPPVVKPPPIVKPPPVIKPPVVKPPVIKPPVVKPPPSENPKDPCPPIPGIPNFPKIPSMPKFPPKDYHHPLFPFPKDYHHPKFPFFPLPPHFPHA